MGCTHFAAFGSYICSIHVPNETEGRRHNCDFACELTVVAVAVAAEAPGKKATAAPKRVAMDDSFIMIISDDVGTSSV